MTIPLVNYSDDVVPLIDPDEEVFLLYTALNNKGEHDNPLRGLGSVDSKRGTLALEFDVAPNNSLAPPSLGKANARRKGRRTSSVASSSKLLQIELHQDTTALRNRSGDTGSVLWQASVDLARLLLDQHRLYIQDDRAKTLFDYSKFSQSHVMELGAGTGLLPIALSSLVLSYTATDLPTELSLIRRNLIHNIPSWKSAKKIFVEPCDWVQLNSTPPHSRSRYFKTKQELHLVLAVDCIFNPALVQPFVCALNHYAISSKTLVMVMMELRSHEVVEQFLEAWVHSADWEIWSVGRGLLHPRYALWVGCKKNGS